MEKQLLGWDTTVSEERESTDLRGSSDPPLTYPWMSSSALRDEPWACWGVMRYYVIGEKVGQEAPPAGRLGRLIQSADPLGCVSLASGVAMSLISGRALPRAARGAVRHRRTFLTQTAYNLAKRAMPKMSETEKIALGAGTVGFDRDIFGGSPSLKHLLDTYTPKLSAEEQSFLDTEVEELCTLLNDHEVTVNKDMSAEAWDYMRCAPPRMARRGVVPGIVRPMRDSPAPARSLRQGTWRAGARTHCRHERVGPRKPSSRTRACAWLPT